MRPRDWSSIHIMPTHCSGKSGASGRWKELCEIEGKKVVQRYLAHGHEHIVIDEVVESLIIVSVVGGWVRQVCACEDGAFRLLVIEVVDS